MNAIIYCRVSTKEQAEQGYSLDGQEKDCRKFAIDHGYEVDKTFIERGESAKTTDRTKLQELIKYTVENKKHLNVLIIWKYDRLARNLSDQTELVKNFSACGLRVLSVTENNDENSVGRLMRNIIGSFAQYENDVKSERTINGMKQAILQGRWCWRAPLGYKQTRSENGKPLLCPDNNAPFLIEAFNLAGTGLYKQTDIVKKIKQKGFKKITEKILNRILRNPLYAGIIKVDWHVENINALHEPLISRELFLKVQAFLSGKKIQIAPKNRSHPDFPLRNFVRCPKCNQKLTGGWSTGRKGIKYPYYHCRTKGCSLNVKKQDLETKFYEHLKQYEPKPEILDLFGAIVLDLLKNSQSEQIQNEYRLDQELKALKENQNKLEELAVKGTFDDESYKRQAVKLKAEILAKQIDLNEVRIDLDDVDGCINYCKFFISNISNLWAAATVDLKQRFQTLIFPEKIYFEYGTFRTTATATIFKELQQFPANKSNLVAPTGFEPVFSA